MKSYDVIFLHAPSVFDFRNRDDILFAYLSTGGTIPVSQIYEMYPLGLRALQTALQNKGKKVAIINLASMMLKNPELDVESFLKTLDARLFGIDLHWLVHTQGSLAVAKLLKKLHPDTPILFGGISSSLFCEELIEYPQVDFVMRGVETSDFVDRLLHQLESRRFEDLPNLCWKDEKGNTVLNEFQSTGRYEEYVNWGYADPDINYFVSVPGAGCEYNCTLCGGSNYSMKKHHGVKDGFAGKETVTFLNELQTMEGHNAKNKRLITLHHWFEDPKVLKRVLDTLQDASVGTIHYTLFHLLSQEHLELMAQYPIKPFFEITLESHDEGIRKKCGKAPFSNEELEKWLDLLFQYHKKASVEIYFMIGLPNQTPEDVINGDVEYCRHLLKKYAKYNLNTLICPMVPFLINGSLVSDNAEEFGYKIFFNKLKDYEKALLVPHWKDSLSYETKWMTREQLVDTSYRACRELVLAKYETNKLPKLLADSIIEKIDSTVHLLEAIAKCDGAPLPKDVRRRILEYNNEILKSTPTQQSPLNFSIYKNWYETW